MTATTIAFDLYARTVSNGFGSAPSGQAYSTSGGAAALYNVGSGVGTIAVDAVNSSRQAILAVSLADIDWAFRFATSAVAAGAFIGMSAMLRRADASNYLYAEARLKPDQSIDLALVSVVATIETVIATTTTGLIHAANRFYRMRANLVGTQWSVKLWYDGATEPAAYQLVSTVSSITAANPAGFRAILATGNTNTLNVTFTVDDLTVQTGLTSLGFPYPLPAENLCGSGLPVRNALRQLADSVQAWLSANLDAPLANAANYAGGVARARVSRSNFTQLFSGGNTTYDTVEFNIGTPTDLGLDNRGPRIGGGGRWIAIQEIVAQPSGDTTMIVANGFANNTFVVDTSLGDPFGGGGGAAIQQSGANDQTVQGNMAPLYTTGPANIAYAAVTIYRLADY